MQAFFIWTAISVLHLYVTRELLARYSVSEVFLTLVQTVLCIAYGLFLARVTSGRGSIRHILRKRLIVKLLPLAFIAVFRDVTKFGGLARISVNLTVTIRSLSPVASVLMQKTFWGDDFSCEVIVSLIPIVAGVSLASAADLLEASAASLERRTDTAFVPTIRALIDCSSSSLTRFIVGCISCISSVFLGVGHSMLTKRIFVDEQEKFDPLSLQVAQSLLSLAFLLPYYSLRLFMGALALSHSSFLSAERTATAVANRAWSAQSLTKQVRGLTQLARSIGGGSLGPDSRQDRKNLVILLAAKGMVNFAQSLFSLISLYELNNVSFNIASSMRRMISGALTVVLFYRASISIYGIVGIATSVAGCLLYERASSRYQQCAKAKSSKSERAECESLQNKRDILFETSQASVTLGMPSAWQQASDL
jgi:drug/metabolite transporter (DMT)-like permease